MTRCSITTSPTPVNRAAYAPLDSAFAEHRHELLSPASIRLRAALLLRGALSGDASAAAAPATNDPAGTDPNGSLYRPADSGIPGRTSDVEKDLVHLHYSINIVWVLVCGFLVMFMQTGFALLETGLCRAKNAAHTMSMNFLVYALGHAGASGLRLRADVRRR